MGSAVGFLNTKPLVGVLDGFAVGLVVGSVDGKAVGKLTSPDMPCTRVGASLGSRLSASLDVSLGS